MVITIGDEVISNLNSDIHRGSAKALSIVIRVGNGLQTRFGRRIGIDSVRVQFRGGKKLSTFATPGS
ncbi:hypothetical protein Tco_1578464 [Tanacetum coccineum]